MARFRNLTWDVFPSVGVTLMEYPSLELGWRFADTDDETGDGADLLA
jgi:hypothetical protein